MPRFWVEQTVGDTVDYGSYTDANGQYYNLNSAYCTTDSLGFVTVRKFARENDTLFTRYSITMDGRTGMIVEVWFSLPAADADERAERADTDAEQQEQHRAQQGELHQQAAALPAPLPPAPPLGRAMCSPLVNSLLPG